MARSKKAAKKQKCSASLVSYHLDATVSAIDTRTVSTAAAAVAEGTVTVSEDGSVEDEFSQDIAEEVVVIKKQAVQKVEPEPAQPPAPFDPTGPLPNLGYACLNVTLRNDGKKPSFFNNRTCRLATLKQKGLEFVSGLALQNCRDLMPILQWNAEHGIKFMRLSSEFFPWGNVHYKLRNLPDYEGIKEALATAGSFARQTGQRLTSHPSEFTKLAGQTEELVASSMADLELHSEMFDLLGFEPSPFNKINIHVGGTYGDKQETLRRFAANFKRLSPACQARVTIENDDRASMFSVADLLGLHEMLKPLCPIVFDLHHWRFATGGMTSEEAMKAAMATWPPGVRPVVHWSESQGGKRPHAHSDYIGQQGRINLHGLDAEVDVMIESKAKELSVLLYRDIAKNGVTGREMFFQGLDEIEAEAARIGAAREAGEEIELEALPVVVLEGTEIIPVNDKRLHGRSQRRNKAQVAARSITAREEAAEQQIQSEASIGVNANGDTLRKPAKRKRRSKEEIEADKAQRQAAKAQREAAKAEKAAVKEAAAAQKEAAKAEKAAAKALVKEHNAAVKAEKAAAAKVAKAAAKQVATAAEVAEPKAATTAPAGKPAKAKAEQKQQEAALAATAALEVAREKHQKAATESIAPNTPQPVSDDKRRRVK